MARVQGTVNPLSAPTVGESLIEVLRGVFGRASVEPRIVFTMLRECVPFTCDLWQSAHRLRMRANVNICLVQENPQKHSSLRQMPPERQYT